MQLRVLEHAAARLAGFATLDAAVRPLFMPAAPFQHAGKLVLRATARGLEPVGLGLGLGGLRLAIPHPSPNPNQLTLTLTLTS